MANLHPTLITPINNIQAIEFSSWLSEHNLCKGAGNKNMRIYRKVNGLRRKRSRDFVYVINANEYRDNLENVHNKLIELSRQVMDEQLQVKNREYIEKMNAVEEDLLMNHGIEMNWTNGKSAKFSKIMHVIKDPEILNMLTEAAKNHKNYDVKNVYLERFRMAAIIEEFGIAPQYDWKHFNVIVKEGKVICAYSFKDLKPLKKETFKAGFFDKFDYNLNICSKENLADIIKRSNEIDQQIQAEL